MKKLLALALALVMVFALAACGESETTPSTEPTTPASEPSAETSTEPSATTAEPVELNIGYMNNYGSLWALAAAQELGYFEEEGITLTLTSFDSGPNIIAAMENGSVDIGYIGDGAHKLCVQGQAEIIALSHISNGDAVIGGPNVTSIADLAGKTVAYSSGTTSENILVQALASEGMTMEDITAMDMDASAIVTAMLSGQVDACAIWSPNSTTVLDELEGATVLADNVTFADSSIALSSWIAMPDRVESDRDVLVRFVRALFRGMDYDADGNYEEVAGWVAGILATDPEATYKEYTSGDWLTGEEVYNGVADGTVNSYYQLQQDLMIANPDSGVTETVALEDYIAFDIMTEAGDSLYGEAAE